MHRLAIFNDYAVKDLLRARKIVHSQVHDNRNKLNAAWAEVEYRVCRVDAPDQDIRLRFNARLTKALTVAVPKPLPSASLLWHKIRIRGIDRKLLHDDIRNGIKIGEIQGWHEHQWNSVDGDSAIINVNDEIKKIRLDFRSFVKFCLERWRIDYEDFENRQGTLFDLPE
jgi:hypothetical protein